MVVVMRVMGLGGKWPRILSDLGFCYETVHSFIVQFCDLSKFVTKFPSLDRRLCDFFLYLNVSIFSTLITVIPKNRRKSNVAIFMTTTTFLLIFTFSFIFLYLFSIPSSIFLCFPLLFITLISHLFSPAIFSVPQLMQCSLRLKTYM
jgi:hypothetical protein